MCTEQLSPCRYGRYFSWGHRSDEKQLYRVRLVKTAVVLGPDSTRWSQQRLEDMVRL